MPVLNYVQIIWRRKWVVLLTFALTAATSTVGAWLLPLRYTATARLQLSTGALGSGERVDYADLLYADRLLNTYARIATSNETQAALAQKFGPAPLPPIQVDALPDTELMQITVKDGDPARAAAVANQLANLLVSRAQVPYGEQGKVMREAIEAQLSQLDKDLATIRRNPTHPSAQPTKGAADLAQLKEELYSRLLGQYQESRVTEAVRLSSLRIVDPALVPSTPSSPPTTLIIGLGLLAGLVAGLGLAFLFEHLGYQAASAQLQAASLPVGVSGAEAS